MRETRAVIVALVINEHLSLILKPSECGGVDDAIAISLETGAVLVFFFRVLAALAFATFNSKRSQRAGL